jgi:photosystem II stability/assembly factor-like uncharacterized protein
MDAPQPETDIGSAPRARVGRAVSLIAASLIAITATSVAFLRPSLFTSAANSVYERALPVPYHVGAVSFVSPTTGWVVAAFESGERATVLHTVDGGMSWAQQLSIPTGGGTQYLRFFDPAGGVFALVGSRPVLYRTDDSGHTWTAMPVLSKWSTALSWSFIDSDHGWILADPGRAEPPTLYRTDDGGWTWQDMGSPVAAADDAFGAQFSFLTTGWLASAGENPYAYKTADFGATWQRVPLPVPSGAEPGGRYFVDVQQTSGGGAIASVVYFPTYMGRSGVGGRIRQFPPMAEPFYDGSRPNNYVYSTMIDQVVGAPYAAVQAPLAELFSSVDDGATWVAVKPPALSGTLGYANPTSWWWVDAGSWSSSADGGATWTPPVGTHLIAPLPGSLQVLDRNHAWFAGIARPALETTSDGGLHWRLVGLPTL